MPAPQKPLSVDIHTATKDGDMIKVQEFLEEGGDVNVRCRYQTIPLHRAAAYSHLDIATLLLEKGADIEARDGVGHTPLFWAAKGGHTDMVDLLLSKGAHINAQDKKEIVGAVHVYPGGVTSIRVMVRATHPYTHIRRMTLAFPVLAGCYAFFLSDTPQRTPLHEAARHGRKEMCALLLKRGAKRDVMDCDANEPGEDSEPTVPENLRRQIRELIES